MKKVFLSSLIFTFLLMTVSVGNAQESVSLSFSDLLKMAMEKNYSILLAGNEYEIAQINNSIGNAGFLPEISVSSEAGNSIVNSHQVFYDGRTRDAKGARNESVSAIAELDWVIFDGARMFIAANRLTELENMGKLRLRMEMESVYMELAANYYRLIQELKWQEVLNSNLDISRQRLLLANKKYILGSASEVDLLQARLDLNTDSNLLISHKTALMNLKADINHLTGRTVSEDLIPADSILIDSLPDYLEIITAAEQQNGELMLAYGNEEIARYIMKESASNFLPTISLYTDYNYSSSQSETGLLSSNKSMGPSYGVRFSYTIFNGFNEKNTHQANRIRYENARLSSEESLNMLQTRIYQTYNHYIAAKSSMDIERKNTEYAEENMKLAIELYRYGQINEIDFREYQRKTIEAENQYLVSEYQLRMDALELLRLCGKLSY
jgi:outer membrane protein